MIVIANLTIEINKTSEWGFVDSLLQKGIENLLDRAAYSTEKVS